MNIAKFVRTTFFIEYPWWLFLNIFKERLFSIVSHKLLHDVRPVVYLGVKLFCLAKNLNSLTGFILFVNISRQTNTLAVSLLEASSYFFRKDGTFV